MFCDKTLMQTNFKMLGTLKLGKTHTVTKLK